MSQKSTAEYVGNKIITGVEDLSQVGTDVFKLLTTANQLTPSLRVELSQLISDAELVSRPSTANAGLAQAAPEDIQVIGVV
ncbi:hypothetical protein [Tunturiibacter gelidoferens]|uniref:Uncharacterized protein n=1 Tax=Tunturiibacter gelidiferens TaxID=3069689 RepID=A0A9X0QFF5_9BACT|nr:hypothetical protein [Edaphobacter lichenicola]MBB5329441.1 hypothetical protein [Edaphobacter lichenicola]